jgi:cell division protein FtsW
MVCVLALLGLGSVTVFSSSTDLSQEIYRSAGAMTWKHLTRVAIGLFLLFVFARMDYRVLRRLSLPLVVTAAAMLAMTLIPGFPLARTVKGATRWLDLGFLVIQPAEIAKIAMVIFVAAVLSQGEGPWKGGPP